MPVPREGDKRSKKRVCERVKLSTGDVGVLLFADDMVIMAESKEGHGDYGRVQRGATGVE